MTDADRLILRSILSSCTFQTRNFLPDNANDWHDVADLLSQGYTLAQTEADLLDAIEAALLSSDTGADNIGSL